MALSGPEVDWYVLVSLVLALGMVALLVARRSLKFAFAAWLCSVSFVPIWIGANVPYYFPVFVAAAILVLVALVPAIPQRILGGDWGVAFFLATCMLPYALGAVSFSSVFVVLVYWTVGFLLGRLIGCRIDLAWIYRAIAVVFTVVAALAVLEFLLSWNPFVGITAPNQLYLDWGPLQQRGGVIRAEGAFGHSITLGVCLALALPITLAARFRLGIRVGMALLQVGGTVVSFSRIGMICACLALVLSVLFLREELSRRLRLSLAGAFAVLGVSVVPFVTKTFVEAGDEAVGSAAYRGDLLSLFPAMQPLGLAANVARAPTGELYFGSFQSIDNAIVLAGLTYGWIPMAVATVLLVCAVGVVLARRATPVTIAVVAQIPALMTVALITQYAIFLWFMIGLAVYSQSAQALLRDAKESQRWISAAI